jgi:uncharacterized membrane protein
MPGLGSAQPRTRGASFVTWTLALCRLLADAAEYGGGASEVWLTLFGEPIRGYTVMAWLLAAAGQVIAGLIGSNLASLPEDRASSWLRLSRLTSVVATMVWVLASLLGLPPLGATVAMVVWAWLLIAGESLPQNLGLASQAVVVLMLASLKWVLSDTLNERLRPGWDPLHYFPLFNPVMGTGALLALSLAGVSFLHRRGFRRPHPASATVILTDDLPAMARTALIMGLFVIGLSFEVDRFVERQTSLGYDWIWPPAQVKLFGLTLLWGAAVLTLALLERKPAHGSVWIWACMMIVVGKFLLVDTLMTRLAMGPVPAPVPIIFNLQVFTSGLLLGALLVLPSLAPLEGVDQVTSGSLERTAKVLAMIIAWWAGTLEIDRAFATRFVASRFGDPDLAKQMGISLYWSLLAIGAIVAGFRLRASWLRYFGLALFAVTLVKVGAVDISQVRYGYRVLSALGLGLLLLATSVLYGRLSPRLLQQVRPTGDLPQSPSAPP